MRDRRHRYLRVRVTDAEMRAYTFLAGQLGVRLSQWVRHVLRDAAIRGVRRAGDRELLKRLTERW